MTICKKCGQPFLSDHQETCSACVSDAMQKWTESEPIQLTPVLNSLEKAIGAAVYVAGGYIRDFLLGLDPSDIDVVTSLRISEAEKLLIQKGFNVAWINKDPGTIAYKSETGLKVEVTQTRSNPDRSIQGGPIEEDLLTRDFTINAVAWNPTSGYIDPTGGIEDIQEGILKFSGHPRDRLDEDPRRWFRAYRFRYGLGLTFDEYTKIVLEQFPVVPCMESKEISIDIAMTEIFKLWAVQEANILEWGKALYSLGVLQYLWPELEGSHKLIQNPEYHPEGDVLTHILEATQRATAEDRIYVFHHDIGKPNTAEWHEKKGWYTFYRHGSVGKKLMPNIGKRLRLSNEVTQKCQMVCYYHMAFPRVDKLEKKHIRKFQRKVGAENLQLLHRCIKADIGDRKGMPPKELFKALPPEETGTKLDISGNDLLIRGIPEGPEIGRKLTRVREAILETGQLSKQEQLKIAIGG